MEKVSEMTSEPIIGKFYLVECVEYIFPSGYREWCPVVGKPHEDTDLGISAVHYHIDSRFKIGRPKLDYSLGAVLPVEHVLNHELKKLKCKAPFGYYYFNHRWCKPFEEKYAGRKAICGKCPHKGFPIESLPKDESGLIICNGHGLAIRNGVVVKRKFPAAKGERG